MKCQIGEAIEKIDKLISNNSKVDDNTINQLTKVKKKLNSVKDIRMSRMQNTTPGSESKKSIHPSLSGKIILANSGIGKSYAKRIYNNIVDGDDLFRDAANFILEKYNQSKYKIDSVSNMRGVFELWGEYSSDIDKVTEAKKRRDEVYRKYAEFAKESSKNGMTVLSSSAREPIISIADFAIVQNDAETIAKNRSSELRENKEELSVEKAKEKIEAFKTKVSGIKTINLGKGQYISEILEKGVSTTGFESKRPEFDKKGFNGYVSIKDTGGKGTPEGDAKDKAMRKVANGYILEFAKYTPSSTLTSYSELSQSTTLEYLSNDLRSAIEDDGVTYASGFEEDGTDVIILARNGTLKNRPLIKQVKDQIQIANNSGAIFVVGDMPGVDTQFIEYLNEIGASYKVYTTNEAGKEFDRKGINGSKYRNIVETKSQVKTKSLEPEVVYNNKYETISKDDIEAAKDIMSNNKKECE